MTDEPSMADELGVPRAPRRTWRAAMAVTAGLAVLAAVVTFVVTDRHPTVAVNAPSALPVRFDYTLQEPTPLHATGQFDGRAQAGWVRVDPHPEPVPFDRAHAWVPARLAGIAAPAPFLRFDLTHPSAAGSNTTVEGALKVASNLQVENPFTYFDRIRSGGTKLISEGHDVVRGWATTRYRVEIAGLVPADAPASLRDLSFHVWIDETRHVRRIQQSLAAVDISRLEFFDFGAPLEHFPPPASAWSPAP